MSRRMQAFTFTKWYLDCEDDCGRIAIGYWASLAWRGIALTWQSLSLTESGACSIHRSRLAGGDMPVREGGRILWRAPVVGCTLTADARHEPLAVRLLENDRGFVDWCCEAPAAMVTLDISGRSPIRGAGYVERLELTIPPWRLPISELRWGRWISDDAAHSVVWIDWRGAEPRAWTFVDGMPVDDVSIAEDRLGAGTTTLMLTSRSPVFSGVPDTIIRSIPALRAVAPASLLTLRQTKWSSQGILQGVGAAPVRGRAIHELVTFR